MKRRLTSRLALVTGSALLTAGLGTGVAVAATHTQPGQQPSAPTAATTRSTSAAVAGDTGESAEQPGAPDTAGNDADHTQAGGGVQGGSRAAEQPGAEKADRSGADTDGPGGHADPEGQQVDHQFNGNE